MDMSSVAAALEDVAADDVVVEVSTPGAVAMAGGGGGGGGEEEEWEPTEADYAAMDEDAERYAQVQQRLEARASQTRTNVCRSMRNLTRNVTGKQLMATFLLLFVRQRPALRSIRPACQPTQMARAQPRAALASPLPRPSRFVEGKRFLAEREPLRWA